MNLYDGAGAPSYFCRHNGRSAAAVSGDSVPLEARAEYESERAKLQSFYY